MIDYKNISLQQLLEYEISQIEDDDLKSFVETSLSEVDKCHSYKPASSTGKYHPPYANGDGGLIRHTKVVVRVLLDFIRATPSLQSIKDEMLSAAILHDMWKYYKGSEQEFTAFEHPTKGKDFCYKQFEKTNDERFKLIGDLIGAHQGIWYLDSRNHIENAKPSNFPEYVLHYADYVASRPYLNAYFDDDGNLILSPHKKEQKRRIIK